MNDRNQRNFARRHPYWIVTVIALIILVLVFDWNWFRHPLENYISQKTKRTFTISNLDVKLRLNPIIQMRDVYFSNAQWSKEPAMAKIKNLELSVSLREILSGKILIPRVALTDADLVFEKFQDGEKNWVLSDPTDKSPSKLTISTLSINKGKLHYIDHSDRFDITILANIFDNAKQDKVTDAAASPDNKRFTTRYSFSGHYRDARFDGNAFTGDVLSFQKSNELFPFKGHLNAGTTKLDVDGSIADAASISAIDVKLSIKGETLANLYPFLVLPLPASPPYDVQGRLRLADNVFRLDDLIGKIGSTDIKGNGTYVQRKPRPLLKLALQSDLLNISDLGPLIGIKTKTTANAGYATQAETKTKDTAKQHKDVSSGEKVLPAGSFEGSRLNAIDAEAKLDAKHLKAPTSLPFESLHAVLKLQDAVLKLTPLEFGFAKGVITSHIVLDARQPLLRSEANVDFRHIHIQELVPKDSDVAKGTGNISAKINLKGVGNSIANIAAKSNGSIAAVLSKGRISNLLDAASGLNGGKILRLLASGDKEIAINCGAVSFDVTNGQGKSTAFLIDTDQTQILGDGTFDLDKERFDVVISPKPKEMGILSLRTPVRVFGNFKHADFKLEKGPLLARVGGFLALSAVAPVAALVATIETGQGKDTNCSALIANVNNPRVPKKAK